jgi:hypothetical protein
VGGFLCGLCAKRSCSTRVNLSLQVKGFFSPRRKDAKEIQNQKTVLDGHQATIGNRVQSRYRSQNEVLGMALLIPALGTLMLGIFPDWIVEFAGKSSAAMIT